MKREHPGASRRFGPGCGVRGGGSRRRFVLCGVAAILLWRNAATAASCGGEDGVFTHGRRDQKAVALTFDACPTRLVPGFAAEIVDTLIAERVPATFFFSGRWAQAHREALGRVAAEPLFEIALHGHRHPRLLRAPAALVREEIESGRAALVQAGVQAQPLFRPPYGDVSATVVQTAASVGVTVVTWDVAPGDPVAERTAADIERAILRRVQGGSIVVMHVNGRGVGTPGALPKVIAKLRDRGFEFVRVSELLRRCESESAAPARSAEKDDEGHDH